MSKGGSYGYSGVFEKEYVMDDHVQIPFLKLLKDKITVPQKKYLHMFAKYCRDEMMNPNCTTTFYKWVKKSVMTWSNLEQRCMAQLIVEIRRAIREISIQSASSEPPVSYHFIAKRGAKKPFLDVHVRPTQDAILARVIQKDAKDVILRLVVEDGRPVLDLGGGVDALTKAAEKVGLKLPEVTSYDLVKSPEMSFRNLYLRDFSGRQIVSNHSSYHIHPRKWLEIVDLNPKGVVLVVDSDAAEFSETGNDYEFSGVRIPVSGVKFGSTMDVEAYSVSGNIFSLRTKDPKGRVFTNEVWYSRRQWVKWGFDLFPIPTDQSPFVQKHMVIFTRGIPWKWGCLPLTPAAVMLGEGEEEKHVSRKQPKLRQLFETRESRILDMRQLYGQPIYQTPKCDGFSMMLRCDAYRMAKLTDRTGVTYVLKDGRGKPIYFNHVDDFVLMVEIIPTDLSRLRYAMYLNQVIVPMKNVASKSLDFIDELTVTVSAFNSLCKATILGRKDCYLTKNKVLSFKSVIPHDGVVYIPAICSSHFLDPYVYPLHGFIKPFQATDTSPYIIRADQIRSLERNPFNLFYRREGATIETDAPFSSQVDKVFRSVIVNPNDFFGDNMISPLLYEGYMVPAGILDNTKKDSFVVTHVRGDKTRRDCAIKRSFNVDWLQTGKFGFTRFGTDASDVAFKFFSSLSSSRIMKLLPSHVGKYSDFLHNFVVEWAKCSAAFNFEQLNLSVEDGWYRNNANRLLFDLKLTLEPNVALFVASAFLRYPFVRRSLDIIGDKIVTNIEIPLRRDYKMVHLDNNFDAFGLSEVDR